MARVVSKFPRRLNQLIPITISSAIPCYRLMTLTPAVPATASMVPAVACRAMATSGHPYTVLDESKESLKSLIATHKKVLAYFTATWCGPCRAIAPHFASIAENNNKNIIFVKIDVDENDNTAGEAGIRAVPTFIAYQDGKKVKEFSGASIEQLQGVVEALAAK